MSGAYEEGHNCSGEQQLQEGIAVGAGGVLPGTDGDDTACSSGTQAAAGAGSETSAGWGVAREGDDDTGEERRCSVGTGDWLLGGLLWRPWRRCLARRFWNQTC